MTSRSRVAEPAERAEAYCREVMPKDSLPGFDGNSPDAGGPVDSVLLLSCPVCFKIDQCPRNASTLRDEAQRRREHRHAVERPILHALDDQERTKGTLLNLQEGWAI
jgi:hypothetical protein